MPKRRLSKQAKKKAKLDAMPPMDFKNPPLDSLAWKKPITQEDDLEKLVEQGLLPERAIGHWRAPKGDEYPGAGGHEIVMFTSFVQRGLGLPTSKFFRYFLHYYGLTVNHLTPNAILHISIFVHLCEAFIGICPSFLLFRHFFWVKAQPSDQKATLVGGAGIQLRIDSKADYLVYDLPDSVKEWNYKWFYMYNHPPVLAKHTGFAPRKRTQWLEKLTEAERLQIEPFIKQIDGLKTSGVTREIAVKSFITHRIQPLAQRVNYGFEYLGTKDPSRTKLEELSSRKVLAQMKELLKGVDCVPEDVMHPFCASRSHPEVKY